MIRGLDKIKPAAAFSAGGGATVDISRQPRSPTCAAAGRNRFFLV
jgi:hypothetical protein